MLKSPPGDDPSPATTWGLGDYPEMAARLLPAAEAAVDACRIGGDDVVLDLACGTGNAALLAAERGAVVHGVDFEPALLRIAERRASAAGMEVDWRLGELSSVPLPDGRITALVSVFGAMYAAKPPDAAAELARVCAPGARLALTAWAAGSFIPAFGQVVSGYLPPPAGAPDPGLWARQPDLEQLLAPQRVELREIRPGRVDLRFDDPRQAAEFLIRTAGHLVAARSELEARGDWQRLTSDVHELVVARSSQGDATALTLDYVIAVAEKL